MNGWEKWFTGNCASGLLFTLTTNGLGSNQILSWKIWHKIIFAIQTDYIIQARRQGFVSINEKKKVLI